ERAIREYRTRYWDRYRLGEIEDTEVACKVFDICVWMGPDDAATYLQAGINAAAGRALVVVDGVIGSKTLDATRRVDPRFVVVALRVLAYRHVHRRVREDPSQERFLRGWERRALS